MCALTALGLVLRLTGFREALFGDELYLYEIARHSGLGSMLNAVHDTESTPPFHFLLAWAAVKLGDPTVTVRLPSLVLGTATIPLTYLLGARTVGRCPALLGAALLTVSPFALWYSDEARAYSTMTFLAVLSALALVLALETRRLRWWVVYAVAACLILYTHYMGVFVVVAQAAWAFWTQRDRWRELAWANGAVALGYVPWIPSFVVQSHDTSANRISTFKQFTPKGVVRELTISVDGHPFLPLESVPGRAALVLLGVGAAAALAGRSSTYATGSRPPRASGRAGCWCWCSRWPPRPAWRSTASRARTPTYRATSRPPSRRSAWRWAPEWRACAGRGRWRPPWPCSPRSPSARFAPSTLIVGGRPTGRPRRSSTGRIAATEW